MARIVRVADVMIEAGITIPNTAIIKDEIFQIKCPTCGEIQLLSQSPIYEEAGETFYRCKNGCQTILVVGKPGTIPIEGRGYRLKNYVVRNTNDLLIITPTDQKVFLPKSPAALD
jgi:hypothetical protein